MVTNQCDSVCEAWSKSIAQRPRGDRNERVIPTGAEGQEVERKRADEAELKAKRLAERLRAMDINPDEI